MLQPKDFQIHTGTPPKTTLVSNSSNTATRPMVISGTELQNHGLHGSTEAGVCVDIFSLCYHKGMRELATVAWAIESWSYHTQESSRESCLHPENKSLSSMALEAIFSLARCCNRRTGPTHSTGLTQYHVHRRSDPDSIGMEELTSNLI